MMWLRPLRVVRGPLIVMTYAEIWIYELLFFFLLSEYGGVFNVYDNDQKKPQTSSPLVVDEHNTETCNMKSKKEKNRKEEKK